MRTAYGGNIHLAVMYVLAALNHYGAQAKLNKMKCRKESARASSNNHDRGLAVNRAVVYAGKLILGWLLIYKNAQGKVYEYGSLSGIDTFFERTHGIDCAHIQCTLP